MLDNYCGRQVVRFDNLDGHMVRVLAQNDHLRPNDLVCWSGEGVWFYAWQVGLFTEEQLQGITLKDDNLPPSCRGCWQPEPHPLLPEFLDKHGQPFASGATTFG